MTSIAIDDALPRLRSNGSREIRATANVTRGNNYIRTRLNIQELVTHEAKTHTLWGR